MYKVSLHAGRLKAGEAGLLTEGAQAPSSSPSGYAPDCIPNFYFVIPYTIARAFHHVAHSDNQNAERNEEKWRNKWK